MPLLARRLVLTRSNQRFHQSPKVDRKSKGECSNASKRWQKMTERKRKLNICTLNLPLCPYQLLTPHRRIPTPSTCSSRNRLFHLQLIQSGRPITLLVRRSRIPKMKTSEYKKSIQETEEQFSRSKKERARTAIRTRDLLHDVYFRY